MSASIDFLNMDARLYTAIKIDTNGVVVYCGICYHNIQNLEQTRRTMTAIISFMCDPHIRGGGPRRYLEHLLCLENAGYSVTLCCNKHLSHKPQLACRHILTAQKERPMGGWALHFARSVTKHTKQLRAHIGSPILIYGSCNIPAAKRLKRMLNGILIFDPRSNPLIELALLIKQERSLWRKFVHFVRMQKERIYEQIMKKYVDFYLFQTKEDEHSYQERIGFKAYQSAVIPNSIDGARFGSAHRLSNSSVAVRHILFCGSLTPLKGVFLLAQAFAKIIASGIEMRLTIAGSGPEMNTVISFLKRANLESRVQVLGWVDDCIPLMTQADLLVVPSLYDALPDVLLEGFHSGIVVIGSDIAGIQSTLKDPQLLFKPNSVDAIVERICYFYHNPTRYRDAKKRISKRYRDFDFDWADRFQKIIGKKIETYTP